MTQNINIRVTNGNDFPITDMYDGIPYTFEPRKSVTVPFDAAVHFFGFAWNHNSEQYELVADFNHVSRRWGWNTVPPPTSKDQRPDFDGQLRRARGYFANLKIQPVRYTVTEEAIEDEQLPAPRIGQPQQDSETHTASGRRRRTMQRKPLTEEQKQVLRDRLATARTQRQERKAARIAAVASPEEAPPESGDE